MDHLGMVFIELGLLFVAVSALGMLAQRWHLSPICLLYTSRCV